MNYGNFHTMKSLYHYLCQLSSFLCQHRQQVCDPPDHDGHGYRGQWGRSECHQRHFDNLGYRGNCDI